MKYVQKLLFLTILFGASLYGFCQETLTNGAILPNDESFTFLNNSDVDDGTEIRRFTGNALRFRYTGNNLVFDALGNHAVLIKNSSDETKINLNPAGESYFSGGGLKVSGGRVIVGTGITGNANYDDITVGDASANAGIQLFGDPNGWSGLSFHDSNITSTARTDYDGGLYYNHTDNEFELWNNKTKRLMINSSGDFGIGTDIPNGKFHVVAGATAGLLRAITVENDDATNGSTAVGISFIASGGNQKRGLIAFHRTSGNGKGDLVFALNNTDTINDAGLSHEVMRLVRSGNVGIGTSSPSEKLEVNGTIRTKEVKVEASPWPDYVFDPDYELRSLEDTEAFIKENKHLPEIPSASELETSGLQLGEMNRLLVKKIEELTLYIIEQEKRIQKLESNE